MKVFIAVPCLGEVRWETALAIQRMAAAGRPPVEVFYLSNVPIEAARNLLAERFLASDAEVLLFLDSDIAPPDGVLALAGAGVPVVGAWCPLLTRDHELHPNLYRLSPDGRSHQPCWEESDVPIRVDAVGMGCTFIRREVLERLARPWFAFERAGEGAEGWIGEDIAFCRKAREAGFGIWAAPSVKCGHVKAVDLLALYRMSR